MKFLIVAATLLSAATSVAAYPVKADSLNCRASPSTTAKILKTYKKGQDVKITCQTTGPNVSGTTVWDKTSDGCYVSDYYIKTGHSSFIPGVARCGGGTTPNPPSGGSACKGINTATVNLIKDFEGFEPRPAPDPIGLPTVGYGHLCKTKSCGEAGKFPLTHATAAALLQRDAKTFTKCVAEYIKDSVKLNDNQFGALVSWAFNVGCGNVRSSQLIKRLNRGESPNVVAAQELPKWNKAGNPLRVFAGLTRRRKAEVALFKKASSKQAHPKCT